MASRPAKIGRKNTAVNPMAVGISGGSNQPPPSECHTRYPAEGYARQKTANGMVMSKMSPARFGFRNATMQAAMNRGPKSAPPTYEIQRSNQPGSLSPNGGHAIPNLANARKPIKKPSATATHPSTIARIGRTGAKLLAHHAMTVKAAMI